MSRKGFTASVHMPLVSEADDAEAPTVLIVDNNEMAVLRLKELFRVRDFKVEICTDGDIAVDEYIRLDPELVILALDIPTMDGHAAALEMRETGGDCRIIFTAPRRQRTLAMDAAYSAGAVAWLEKPITSANLDAVWEEVLGEIPEAPGLEDIDEIHPHASSAESEDETNEEITEEDNEIVVEVEQELVVDNPPKTQTKSKKSSRGKRLVIVLLLLTGLAMAGLAAWKKGWL